MKKIISIFTCLLIITLFACGGPKVYQSKSFERTKKTIKTLAILPFNVSIAVAKKQLSERTTMESIKESEQKTGYNMQNSAQTWFLNKLHKYTITFQDINKTNSLLKKGNLQYADIISADKTEICKLLGVDGVISGRANLSKPLSDGVAIALNVLVGFSGRTNSISTSLDIHDVSGELLWKFDHRLSGSVGSTSDNITSILMKSASKKFPFR